MDSRTSPGVLGAGGVSHVSQPEHGDTDESSSGEKLSDEIDVEGDFDTEWEESIQKASRLPCELPGKHKEETENNSSPKIGIVGDTVGESPSEKRAGKTVTSVTEKVPVEVAETDLERGEPKQPPELAQKDESQKKVLSKSENPQVTATSLSDDGQTVVSISASGLVPVVPSERSAKMTSSDSPVGGQSSDRASEPAAKIPLAKAKAKSFEDAFKESIGIKLNVDRPQGSTTNQQTVDGDSSRPVSTEDRGRELDPTDPSGEVQDLTDITSSGKELLDEQSCMADSPGKGKSESAVGTTIDAVASEEETEDIKDIDNFSSDSSSTIIDIELAAKESTEEEIPGSRSKVSPNETSQNEKSSPNQETESGMNEKIEDRKPGPNPSLRLKFGAAARGEQKSSPAAEEPVVEEASDLTEGNRKPVNRKITEEKRSEQSCGESAGHEEATPNSGSAAVGDKQRSCKTGEERSSGNEELHGKSSPLDRSELKLETGGEEGRARPRERSKSDDSQTVLGKKFRISKHGIVLQPGTKLEAMDYSKKWYIAKIVSVDETDQTVLIHFDGWNSRFDEWLEFDSDRLRPLARVSARRETAKEVKALGGYKIGDEVLARWSDCRYYPAKILGIKTNGSYRVLFYDGIEKTVMGINVRDMPESLKSQHFFSNLEHQFRALLNKKRRSSKDGEGKTKESRLSKGSTSGSRPSSPVQTATKRRHSSSSQSSTPQPAAKRSRVEGAKITKIVTHKGQRIVQTPGPPSPPAAVDQPELLPSPTSSEASELMSALEHGMIGGKKRYREPLIFDKNSGLIRDPTRLVAPKELVIDLDHNKYKCDVPDCGKGFRKASLLEYHKKYYHVNKPATSTSAMTAAKNAVTRSRKRLSTSAMAPGTSKMRRTESLDRSPGKVTSRPHRASAPSILTTSHKHPLSSSKTDDRPARPQQAQPHRVIRSGQFLKQQAGVAEPRKHLSTVRTERPASKPEPATPSSGQQQQTAAMPKDQGPEAAPKVMERPRRSSGGSSSKEDKSSTSKWEGLSTPIKEEKMSPKIPTPSTETKMKAEEPADIPVSDEALKTVKLEDKLVTGSKDDLQGKATGQDAAGDDVAAAATSAAAATREVLKKRRNKPHKKHKRHKTRSRDRRTREQSRSERRRAAERAKQRRQEQRQQKQATVGARPRPEDVMAWTAKYLLPNADNASPAARSSEDPSTKQDMADSSATDDGGPKEMISCVCRNSEEEGFMIQCEACFGWQHGGCVGLTEHTVPKRYVCSFCIHPENLRTHARHRYNQDWFLTGRLPALVQPKEPTEGTSDQTGSMLKAHQLMADMINVTEALDALQHKLHILKSDNHPDLKLWSYNWGLNDDSAPQSTSPRSRKLYSSLEETDLHQTSTDNSALTESLRSDMMADSITEEVVVEEAPSSSQVKRETSSAHADDQLGIQGVISDSLFPEVSDRAGGGGQDGIREAASVLSTGLQNEESQVCPRDQTPGECPMDVDGENQPGSHSSSSRQPHQEEAPSLPEDRVPVASNESNQTKVEIDPTEKHCFLPDTVKHAGPDQQLAEGTPGPGEDPNSSTKDPDVPPAEKTAKDEVDTASSDQKRPGAPKQDRKTKDAAQGYKTDDGDSSDDEPLIKYSSKHISSSLSSSEESKDVPVEEGRSPQSVPVPPAIPSLTPPVVPGTTPPSVPNPSPQVIPSATPPAIPNTTLQAVPNPTLPPVPSPIPPPLPSPSPSATLLPTPVTPNQAPSTSTPSDRRPRAPPSSAQSVPTSVCKLHLFNHIVCVEDELKRRMDYVEDQIEALEQAFAQSTGGKEATFIPPDPQQMKQTITSLIDDLEKVNKLVSI